MGNRSEGTTPLSLPTTGPAGRSETGIPLRQNALDPGFMMFRLVQTSDIHGLPP
jgi:hypothetical protein